MRCIEQQAICLFEVNVLSYRRAAFTRIYKLWVMHSSIPWQLDNWYWIGWLLDLQKYLKLIIVNIFMGYKNRKISPQIATCLFTIWISQWADKYMKHANSFLSLQMRWRTYYGSLTGTIRTPPYPLTVQWLWTSCQVSNWRRVRCL